MGLSRAACDDVPQGPNAPAPGASKTFLLPTCECANLGAILAGSADEMLLAIAADEDAGLGWLRRKSMQKDFNFN